MHYWEQRAILDISKDIRYIRVVSVDTRWHDVPTIPKLSADTPASAVAAANINPVKKTAITRRPAMLGPMPRFLP